MGRDFFAVIETQKKQEFHTMKKRLKTFWKSDRIKMIVITSSHDSELIDEILKEIENKE